MGVITSFSRSMYLTNYINTLKAQLNDVMELQTGIMTEVSQLMSDINDIGENDSPAVKQLKARQTELEALDRQLQARLKKIQAMLDAAQTEIQSADQMLSRDIQTTCRYGLAG